MRTSKTVAKLFRTVAADSDRYFVPLYLGSNHNSHSPLFCLDQTCLIWDGTYYYIQKPGDALCRQTYSGHKHRPLVKFMSIVLPGGYVLESIDPYFADGKNNNVGITQHILSLHDELTGWLEEGDVCVPVVFVMF